jgi:hypothetical protein
MIGSDCYVRPRIFPSIADAALQVGINLWVSKFGQKFVQLGNSVPGWRLRVTDKPIHFLGTNRRYASGLFVLRDLRDVHGFWGGRFGLDADQAREVFTEDQIQLIGIEARVFDDLADLETERQFRVVRTPPAQRRGREPRW